MGKKRDEVDGELNITSMMDMMTIILVFLLKSFGENAITVKPSDKMRLPFSNAEIQPHVRPIQLRKLWLTVHLSNPAFAMRVNSSRQKNNAKQFQRQTPRRTCSP